MATVNSSSMKLKTRIFFAAPRSNTDKSIASFEKMTDKVLDKTDDLLQMCNAYFKFKMDLTKLEFGDRLKELEYKAKEQEKDKDK